MRRANVPDDIDDNQGKNDDGQHNPAKSMNVQLQTFGSPNRAYPKVFSTTLVATTPGFHRADDVVIVGVLPLVKPILSKTARRAERATVVLLTG